MGTPVQEIRFEYEGFPCVVMFMTLGFRCGYVGLPRENKYYGKDYNSIPVNCHGGLTYAEDNLFGQDDQDTWWIGFDCGHCFDGFDIEKFKEYYQNDEQLMKRAINSMDFWNMVNAEHEVRTKEYVAHECIEIVKQLLQEEENI